MGSHGAGILGVTFVLWEAGFGYAEYETRHPPPPQETDLNQNWLFISPQVFAALMLNTAVWFTAKKYILRLSPDWYHDVLVGFAAILSKVTISAF